jgi:hypothetical protein
MTKYNVAHLAISLGTLGLLNALSLPATAEDLLANKGVRFAEDTIVEFEFIESHGAYQSAFGVIDLSSCQSDPAGVILFDTCTKTPLLQEVKAADTEDTIYRSSTYETDSSKKTPNTDFLGTPGNAVPKAKTEFLFKAERKYAFYLESQFNGRYVGTVYTTDFFNSQGNRQAIFNGENLTKEEIAQNLNGSSDKNHFAALIDGGVSLNFDDTGSTLVRENLQDTDFDDFIVGIGGSEPCAEPESAAPEVSLNDR